MKSYQGSYQIYLQLDRQANASKHLNDLYGFWLVRLEES